jgi:hypothetical protein
MLAQISPHWAGDSRSRDIQMGKDQPAKREEPAEAMLRTGSYAIASKPYSLEPKVPGGWGADESGTYLSELRADTIKGLLSLRRALGCKTAKLRFARALAAMVMDYAGQGIELAAQFWKGRHIGRNASRCRY